MLSGADPDPRRGVALRVGAGLARRMGGCRRHRQLCAGQRLLVGRQQHRRRRPLHVRVQWGWWVSCVADSHTAATTSRRWRTLCRWPDVWPWCRDMRQVRIHHPFIHHITCSVALSPGVCGRCSGAISLIRFNSSTAAVSTSTTLPASCMDRIQYQPHMTSSINRWFAFKSSLWCGSDVCRNGAADVNHTSILDD